MEMQNYSSGNTDIYSIKNKIDRTKRPIQYEYEVPPKAATKEICTSPPETITTDIEKSETKTFIERNNQTICALLLCAVCVVFIFLGGIFPMIAIYTDNFKSPCYDYQLIRDYGKEHKYCNTDEYNNSKFEKLVEKGEKCKGACLRKHWSGKSKEYICDDYVDCADFDCILSSRIRISSDVREELVRFEECYDNIKKSYFEET